MSYSPDVNEMEWDFLQVRKPNRIFFFTDKKQHQVVDWNEFVPELDSETFTQDPSALQTPRSGRSKSVKSTTDVPKRELSPSTGVILAALENKSQG